MSAYYECECDNFDMTEGQDSFEMNEGIPGPGVPAGGSAGQGLRKTTSADYDTEWDTLTAGDVAFNKESGYVSGTVGRYLQLLDSEDVQYTYGGEKELGTVGETLDYLADKSVEIEEALDDLDDGLDDLKNTLDFNLGNEMIQLNMGYYINTAVSTGSEVSLTPISNAAGMGYAIISCSEGDMFTVKGTSSIGGGITCYLWAFLDSNNKLISKSNPNITVTDLIIMAPANTNKVVFNIKNGCGYKGETIENQKAIKFTDAVCSINPFISWTSGGYINHSTGEVNSNNSFMYTDYIEINTKELRMNKPFYGNAGIAFYDSAKGFISGSGVWNDNIDTDKIIYNINVPANAKFFRTSKINGRPDLIVADIGQFKYLDDTKNIEKLGYVNIPFMIDNAYIHYGTGEVVSNNQFKCTDFFPVYSETIYMQRPYYGNAGIAFYDSTKTYISGIADGAYPGPDLSVYKVSVPSGAKYLRTSLKKDFTNTAMFGSVDTGMEKRLEELGAPVQFAIVCPAKIHIPSGIKYRYYPRQMCYNLSLIEESRAVYSQAFTGERNGTSYVGKEFGDFINNANGDQNIRIAIGFVGGDNSVINKSMKDVTVESFVKPTGKTAKV